MDYKYTPTTDNTGNTDLLERIESLTSELEDTKQTLEKYKELVASIKTDYFTMFCETVKKEVLI